MKYSEFPASGEKVSRVAFGAMGLGGAFGVHQEKELIHSVLYSLEKGVNFIDTARAYGKSENIVGRL